MVWLPAVMPAVTLPGVPRLQGADAKGLVGSTSPAALLGWDSRGQGRDVRYKGLKPLSRFYSDPDISLCTLALA